jgi:hypothetical protein
LILIHFVFIRFDVHLQKYQILRIACATQTIHFTSQVNSLCELSASLIARTANLFFAQHQKQNAYDLQFQFER